MNSSNHAKYLNLASTKSTILMVRMSSILRFAYEYSYLVLSTSLRKLSSNVVEGGAFYGARCGARGGMQAWDDSSCIKSLHLIRLGGGGLLEDIGIQRTRPHPKFVQDT